jgi:hypothetical protein
LRLRLAIPAIGWWPGVALFPFKPLAGDGVIVGIKLYSKVGTSEPLGCE